MSPLRGHVLLPSFHTTTNIWLFKGLYSILSFIEFKSSLRIFWVDIVKYSHQHLIFYFFYFADSTERHQITTK